ncbi:MAG TPA: alpha/beta fold hydrolase [Pseudonocardiaceae bacterium]
MLTEYRSSYSEPEDFDDFWSRTITSAREHDIAVRTTPVETNLITVEVHDLTFAGFGGHPIRAWLRLPRHRTGRLPAVVEFHGYAGGRGAPTDDLLWSSAGYAHLVMDVRGCLTKGIEHRDDYFYRRVYTDAVRAVDAVRALDFVAADRVAVIGNSQGAGIALAVAGLVPEVCAAHFQAPFLSDIRQAVRSVSTAPYSEITEYLAVHRGMAEQVFGTLAYFDGIAFARRAGAPAWFATGLLDDVVPPVAVFGAFHEYRGPKQIQVWQHNGHEAGGADDLATALAAFRTFLHRNEAQQ